jgi:hypothetical protein
MGHVVFGLALHRKKKKNTTLHQWICKQMSKISCIYHNLFRHIQEIKIQALPGRPRYWFEVA